MMRAGRSVLASVALWSVLVLAACGGGSSSESGTTTRRSTAADRHARPTLALSPALETTTTTVVTSTVPLTALDSLPAADGEDTGVPTSFDESGLPTPEPAPLPDAFEHENQIGSLEIPKLSVSQTLYEGVTLKTLDNGPGHWPGTALPGQKGNVVIAGHRVSRTHPFRDLDQLKKGDEVVLNTAQGRHVYLVSKVEIVNPDALWIIKQTPAKTATLFACHPKGSTAKRIVAFLTYAPERSTPAA
jgi:sortase A